MEIRIRYNNGTFFFYRNHNVIYTGVNKRKLLWFEELLYQKDEVVSKMRLKFRLPFKLMYSVNFTSPSYEGSDLVFKGWPKTIIEGTICGDLYSLITHKGLTSSLFKNNKQIAAFYEKRVEFLGNNDTTLVIDDDADLNIALSIILACKCQFNQDYADVTFNAGNMGVEARPFNKKWKPNRRIEQCRRFSK